LLFVCLLLTQAFMCPGTPYHKLVTAEHNFKGVVATFQDVEIAEFQSGGVEPQLHLKIQGGILQVANGGKDLAELIQANATPQTIRQKLDSIYALLDNLLNDGVLHVTNPKSKASLELALDSVKAIVDNVATALGQ